MSKKETVKFIVQLIASIATAIVTALGATSCMGVQRTENETSEPHKEPAGIMFMLLELTFKRQGAGVQVA